MKNKNDICILTSIFIIQHLSFNILSQSIGTGKDGSPNISGIINIYTTAISDIKNCEKKIFVKNTEGFYRDDLILFIQMQGATIDNTNSPSYGTITDYANAGNYEYAIIDSIGYNNDFYLKYPLLRNFSVEGKTQIIRVPQYESPVISATLTCKKWDGETGGVLVFDASGTIFFNANINVNGKGFRGGKTMKGEHFFSYSHDFIGESYNPDLYSLKGEGIAFDGIYPFTSGRGAPANGGGGGNIHTAGGGGAGNFGGGGNGGWGYPVDTLDNEYNSQGIGGYSLNYSSIENKIFMGGGGGAGHEHFNNGTNGGDGGGIIIITANLISGNLKNTMANGNNSASSGAYGDGTGGAGAGGTILLSVKNFLDTLIISVKGGDGGSSIMKGFGSGGGAGGGILWLLSENLPENIVISSLSGGTGGLAGGNSYGAENGYDGGILYDLKIPFNNFYYGVNTDFSFSPNFLSEENKTIAFTNQSSGTTNYKWNFGDETVDFTINPSHFFPNLKNYSVQLIASDSLCSDTFVKNISAELFPNIFTPNNDGKNDFFFIQILDSVRTSELTIFSRWGQIVFQNFAVDKTEEMRWDGICDGKKMPEGVYYFILNYILKKGERKVVKGAVTLLR